MDMSRGPENTKSDLIAVWSAVEAALRSLVGNPSATGQTLIRDARARQAITFDQANALVSLVAVREQLDRPEYQPTESDVNAARSAFLKLDAGLMDGVGGAASAGQSYGSPAPASPYAPGAAAAPKAAAATPIAAPAPGLQPMARPARKRWIVPTIIIVVVIAALAIGGYFMFGRNAGAALMADGVQAYERGDKVTAASKFEQ